MRKFLTVVAFITLSGVLTGCSDKVATPEELATRLAAAQKTLDASPGLKVSMDAKKLPADVSGLKSASGDANRTPAFEGTVEVVFGGSLVRSTVIAVDGGVWAATGLTGKATNKIYPEALNAPDPAELIGKPGNGLTSLLTKADGLKDGGNKRDGKKVVTTITGNLPGGDVADLLPSADSSSTYKVTFRLTEADALSSFSITGPMYGADVDDVTYTVTLKPSKAVKITAPE